MAINYPPMIGDTIPAFFSEKLIIPFSHNIAVNQNNVKGFKLKIKNLSDSSEIATINQSSFTKQEVTFNSNPTFTSLTANQYYKFQLAYVDNENETSPFSNVSVGKFLGSKPETPIVSISGLSLNMSNIAKQSYVGIYNETLQQNEKLYEYKFDLLNNDVIVDTTEWKMTNDNQMIYECLYDLEAEKIYEVRLSIKTINGYEETVEYDIYKAKGNSFIANFELSATQDREALENGYVDLSLKMVGTKARVLGSYDIFRKGLLDNKWVKICNFKIENTTNPLLCHWKDFTVQQGETYIYGIRHNDDNMISDIEESVRIKVDFEHIFLGDANRQLCIRFTPAISSLKNTILETKSDTIGSRFPFFFRNGQVKYKEFPLSGLISYHMDSNNYFLQDSDIDIYEPLSGNNLFDIPQKETKMSRDNFAAERRFKLAVLEWLNNGQPKLLRTPAEGNYVVRLMNVSLSPKTEVTRMLHTFSATAYECMEFDYNKCLENGVISSMSLDASECSFNNPKIIETLIVSNPNKKHQKKYGKIFGTNQYYFELKNVSNIIYQNSQPFIDRSSQGLEEKKETYIGVKYKSSDSSYSKLYCPNGYIRTAPGTQFYSVIIPEQNNMYSNITYYIHSNVVNGGTKYKDLEPNNMKVKFLQWNEYFKSDLSDSTINYPNKDKTIYKYYSLTFEPLNSSAYVAIYDLEGNKLETITFSDLNTRHFKNVTGAYVFKPFYTKVYAYALIEG